MVAVLEWDADDGEGLSELVLDGDARHSPCISVVDRRQILSGKVVRAVGIAPVNTPAEK